MFQSNVRLVRPFEGRIFDAGSRIPVPKEDRFDELSFSVIKCNNRPKPPRRHCVIFSLFGEFGSNTIAALYCIPKLLKDRYGGMFKTVVSWPGTSFLYRHLCDEVWELNSPNIGLLKEKCRSFHHASSNLKRCEELFDYYAYTVVGSNEIGHVALNDIFPNILDAKKNACWTPSPSQDKIDAVKKYVKPNTILVNARNRKCYNRNYSPEFYNALVDMLINEGYHVIWTGDETVMPVVRNDIVDFTKTDEAKDIEYTFALTSLSKCTIQCHTASTRIAAISQKNHILLETADQILEGGNGQERYRLFLADRADKRKVIVSHFWDTYYNIPKAVELIKEAMSEIEQNDFSVKIGLVNNPDYIKFLISNDKLIQPGRVS